METYYEKRAQVLLKLAEKLMVQHRNANRMADLGDEYDFYLDLWMELWQLAYDYGTDYLSEVTKARIERFVAWAETVPDDADTFIAESECALFLERLSGGLEKP